jgi:hypothetical protein
LLYIALQHEALLQSGVNGFGKPEDPARASTDLLSNSRGAPF